MRRIIVNVQIIWSLLRRRKSKTISQIWIRPAYDFAKYFCNLDSIHGIASQIQRGFEALRRQGRPRAVQRRPRRPDRQSQGRPIQVRLLFRITKKWLPEKKLLIARMFYSIFSFLLLFARWWWYVSVQNNKNFVLYLYVPLWLINRHIHSLIVTSNNLLRLAINASRPTRL